MSDAQKRIQELEAALQRERSIGRERDDVHKEAMRKSITLQGVYVGSRRMFLDMNRALALHGLKPVIDHTVPFADARAAYRAMEAAGHFGKIVIAG